MAFNKRLNRKSQESMIYIILAVVLAVVLLVVFPKIMEVFTSKKVDLEACRLSVIAASTVRGSYTEEGPISISVECQTYFDEEIKKMKEKDKVLAGMSDLFHDCWYEFGEGKYNAFEGRMSEKNSHCFVCSKFSLPKGITVTQEDFATYTKDPAHKYKKDEVTYYNFFKTGLLKEPPGRWDIIADSVFGSGIPDNPDMYFISGLNLPEKSTLDEIYGMISEKRNTFIEEHVSEDLGSFFKGVDMGLWLYGSSNMASMDKLSGSDKPYAIIFYQVSKEYWRQMWISRVTAGLVASEFFAVPPAKIFVANYEDIGTDKFDCEILQG